MRAPLRACAKCIKGSQGATYCRERRRHSVTTHPEYFPPGKRDEDHLLAAVADINAHLLELEADKSGKPAGVKVAAPRSTPPRGKGGGKGKPTRSAPANPHADVPCTNGRLCSGAHREFASYQLCLLKHPGPCSDPQRTH